MQTRFLIIAGILGFTGVLAGTVAAHVIQKQITSEKLETFKTGVHYHLLHAAAVLGVAAVAAGDRRKCIAAAGWLFTLGVLLFSGSLYVYACWNVKLFAHVAPFGGGAMMAGWIGLIVAGVMRRRG
ncbi:MAG: DUF423 domain-containing protein [Phycisphaeraceae bacterium]